MMMVKNFVMSPTFPAKPLCISPQVKMLSKFHQIPHAVFSPLDEAPNL